MARNRRTQSAASRFGPAIKALVICLLLGGSGVGYVWQKEQILRLGQQRRAREATLARLEDQNDKLRKQVAKMRSPAVLEARVKELNLGLQPAQPAQKVLLPEPSPEASVPVSERSYPLQANRTFSPR